MSRMTVRLVIDANNRQWIIGKIASRLAENLDAWDVTATIGAEPSSDADINHWMVYPHPWQYYFRAPGFYKPGWVPGNAKNTVLITHIDDPVKLGVVKDSIGKVVDVAICMSRMTKAELAGYGIEPRRLTYINPGHDGEIAPRRITIGITSRLYPDARKREDLLIAAADAMPLDRFRFEIIGEGWEAVAERLRRAGAEVDLGTPGPPDEEYARIRRRLPAFDYYLYLGWDEGSMGTLDALAAGVKTIVTPQGFHLDLERGITHAVRSSADLVPVLRSIERDQRQRTDAVRHLTWPEYARKHAIVWRALLEGRIDDIARDVGELSVKGVAPVGTGDLSAARMRLFRRFARSYLWPEYLESRRFWVRGQLARAKWWAIRRFRGR